MSSSFDLAGLAIDLRKVIEARLAKATDEARAKIGPRLEEVATLLSQVLVLRLGRGDTGEPGELERALTVRFRLLSSALELTAVDALQDSIEQTVGRLVSAAFSALLHA